MSHLQMKYFAFHFTKPKHNLLRMIQNFAYVYSHMFQDYPDDFRYSRHSIIGALPFKARTAPIWESAPIIECLLYHTGQGAKLWDF